MLFGNQCNHCNMLELKLAQNRIKVLEDKAAFWKRRADQRQKTIGELKQNPPDAPVDSGIAAADRYHDAEMACEEPSCHICNPSATTDKEDEL